MLKQGTMPGLIERYNGQHIVSLTANIHGLTLGEARVASLVGVGRSPREAADTLGISEETARTVLKRVYAKTNISKQSQLAVLLTRLTLKGT